MGTGALAEFKVIMAAILAGKTVTRRFYTHFHQLRRAESTPTERFAAILTEEVID